MKYKTDKYMVSFIDILGAKEKIINECDLSLNIVHEVYERALQLYENSNRSSKSSQRLYDDSDQIKIRIFSDNIVLYTKINDNITDCFLHLISLTAFLQGVFLGKGLLVRGGIAMGDFFADDVMIWGTALLDSCKIENSISIYPRIVIHPSIIKAVEDKIVNNFELVSKDDDAHYYVNYLVKGLYYDYDSIIKKAKSMCESELENAHYGKDNENKRIVEKIIWQKNYIKHCTESKKSTLGEIDV